MLATSRRRRAGLPVDSRSPAWRPTLFDVGGATAAIRHNVVAMSFEYARLRPNLPLLPLRGLAVPVPDHESLRRRQISNSLRQMTTPHLKKLSRKCVQDPKKAQKSLGRSTCCSPKVQGRGLRRVRLDAARAASLRLAAAGLRPGRLRRRLCTPEAGQRRRPRAERRKRLVPAAGRRAPPVPHFKALRRVDGLYFCVPWGGFPSLLGLVDEVVSGLFFDSELFRDRVGAVAACHASMASSRDIAASMAPS